MPTKDKAVAKSGIGRPSRYTLKIADEICERIADGESLRRICQDAHMPNKATVFKWLSQHKSFHNQYARARETQADVLADEIVHIADTPMPGIKVKETEDGKREVTTADMIEHRRLQIDARKWYASKLKPKVYGNTKEPDDNSTDLQKALSTLIEKLPS